MSNILIPMMPEKHLNPLSLLNKNFKRKPQSLKYREFFTCLASNNQIHTHIDLNVIEMKGNISICIADVLSMLRRTQNIQSIPK